MNHVFHILSVYFLFQFGQIAFAQNDTLSTNDTLTISQENIIDSTKIKQYNPKKAWKLSAAFPGLGQIYNRSYWKLPIVYGTFTTLGFIYAYNQKNYKNYQKLFVENPDEEVYRTQRDLFKRNRDFTIIIGVVAYLANIIDAYVEAHLKPFDVTDDLTLQFKPALQKAETNTGFGAPSLQISLGF